MMAFWRKVCHVIAMNQIIRYTIAVLLVPVFVVVSLIELLETLVSGG
jgi:hypothetical protein